MTLYTKALKKYPFLGDISEAEELFEGANAFDVKSARGDKSLPHFLADFFSHAPAWLRAGVRFRQVVAGLTGIDLPPLVMEKNFRAEDIPFAPGASFEFFTALASKADDYWIARAGDAHIQAVMIMVRRPPGTTGAADFHVTTIVRYFDLRARIYYFLIRPAHHIGLTALTRAGAAGASQP